MDNNYDKSIHSNPDAKAWAKFFIETISKNKEIVIDEDYMLGWFANSMMAMHDHIHNGEIQTLHAKVASADVLVEALEELLPAYRKVVKLYDSNHDDAYTVKAHNALAKTRSIK